MNEGNARLVSFARSIIRVAATGAIGKVGYIPDAKAADEFEAHPWVLNAVVLALASGAVKGHLIEGWAPTPEEVLYLGHGIVSGQDVMVD